MITSVNEYDYLNTLSSYKITDNSFNKVIIYQINDDVCGFTDYSVMYERAEINYIFVKEKYRNIHIASKMLEYIFNSIDSTSISLEVNINNIAAINLYKKFGFKEVYIRKGYYNGIDGILMLKSR